MIRRTSPVALSALVAALLVSVAPINSVTANPSIYPTGVTRYDSAAAYNCCILFSAGDNMIYLIDMNGNIVHRWHRMGAPTRMLDPALTHGVKGRVGFQLSGVAPQGQQFNGLVPGHAARLKNRTFCYVDWSGTEEYRITRS